MTATEHSRPTLMTRLAAAMHGEIAATTVEAYRRAGAAAYQDMLDAEQLRVSLAASGDSLWTTRPHQASQLLCAWNAFALQTLGDQLVEAEEMAEGGEFVRRLLPGPFHPTDEVDYCDPTADE